MVEVLAYNGRSQELCDGVNDVAEIAVPVPRIPTQMVERTADVPQIPTVQQTVSMPQVTTQVVDVTIASASVANNGRSQCRRS